MNKNIILIVIVCTTLLFTAGYFTGQIMNDIANKRKVEDEKEKTIVRPEPNPVPMPEKVEFKKISGEIAQINRNIIIIKIKSAEPLADKSLEERTVMTATSTGINKLTLKDPATLRKELQEFDNMIRQTDLDPKIKEALTMPETFTKTPAQMNDLETGYVIQVVTDSDINTAKEFLAREINFFQ